MRYIIIGAGAVGGTIGGRLFDSDPVGDLHRDPLFGHHCSLVLVLLRSLTRAG